MDNWTPFPWTVNPRFDSAHLQHQWGRLHLGDAEPRPERADVLAAWALFHNGEFQRATHAGLALGDAGVNVANKATCIYANYLEPREHARQQLLLEAASRAEALQKREPNNAGAWYWQAYALARYSQCISVAKALTQGLGVKIRHALETTIALAPRHAVMQINSSPLDPGVLADSAGFGNTRAKVFLSPRSDGRSASGYTADEIRFCNDYRPANPVARRFH